MNQRLLSLRITKLIRIAIGSGLAILLADTLSLAYSASAGIITLLTIQNTKKETIAISLKRLLSFGLSLCISYPLFYFMGYQAYVFGIFLFLFVGASELLHLDEGIAMNAVLTTHFLIEQTMQPSLIGNELMILVIGMGMGVGLNLMMRKQTNRVRAQLQQIDDVMRTLLRQLSNQLQTQVSIDFDHPKQQINEALALAHEHANNQLRTDMAYFVSYCQMRLNQLAVLENIDQVRQQLGNHRMEEGLSSYIQPMARFMEDIASSYHEENQVLGLFQQFDDLRLDYQASTLPVNRMEFEQRSLLFQMLEMCRQFLLLKRQFVLSLNEKQKEQFWYQAQTKKQNQIDD